MMKTLKRHILQTMGLLKRSKAEQKGNRITREGVSYLQDAIREGNLKLTNILIKGGADVNESRSDDTLGFTALMVACMAWNESFYNRQDIMNIMQMLFDEGADPYK